MNDDGSDSGVATGATSEATDTKKDKKPPVERLWAENLSIDLSKLTASKDSSKIIRNTDWIKNVKNDVQLQETLAIMKDLIQTATFKTAFTETKKN